MSLTLTIISHNRRGLGSKASMTFGQDGGTIGRSLQNDWALPDTKKYLSARHASIDFRSGCYYIVDTSRNGVFINGEHEPVGQGKPQRLFEGDSIRIGEYEMRVAIESVDDTREALIASSHVDPVDLKQRVEAPEPTGYELIEAHAMTGVKLEIELEEEGGELPQSVTDRKRAAARASKAAKSAPKGSQEQSGISLDSFFRGMGIEAPSIEGATAERMLKQIGAITRELVAGLVDNMQLRAVQRAQIGQTSTLEPGKGEDQLDFSRGIDDNLRGLFLHGDASAKPAESVREAFADLRMHQRALLTGNRQALNEYLTRLDPETIELNVTNGKRGAFLNAAHKFRFWDVYRDIFAVLGSRPGDEWPEPFRIALEEAYRKAAKPQSDDDEFEQRAAG